MLTRAILAAATPLVWFALTGCDSETPTAKSASQASSATSSTPAAATCDAAAISRDLGYKQTVVRCYGDWARIDAGGPGDAQGIARLVNGKWTQYTAFPTSICQARARADGVPEPELVSFTTC
jgi:hypothetical protein